jgi:hypothetical protein
VIGVFAADRIGLRPTIMPPCWRFVFDALHPNVLQPPFLVATGFCPLLAIYVLVALLYGIYTPELFPCPDQLYDLALHRVDCRHLGLGYRIGGGLR